MGLGVVGSVFTNNSPATLADVTPIARLTQETEVVVVAKDSPLRTMADLVAAWKADPAGTPVGGGSSPGGPDHLAPMLIAEAIGIVPRDVNYVAYDGGGELLAAVLGGKVAFGVSGLGEYADQIAAGELRLLAVTAGRAGGRGRRAHAARGRAWTSSSPTGAASSPRPDLDDDGPGRADRRLHRAARHARSGGRAGSATAGTTRSCRPTDFGAFLASENERVAGVLRGLGLAK